LIMIASSEINLLDLKLAERDDLPKPDLPINNIASSLSIIPLACRTTSLL